MARAEAVHLSRHVPDIAEAHQAVLNNRAADALERLGPHLEAHPEDPVALLVAGEALARTGRMVDAVASFEAALAFMPEYREARLALARAHYQRFDPRAALRALDPLLETGSSDVALLRWQAALLAEAGEYADAEALHRRLLELEPSDPALLVGYGDILRTLGRPGEAANAYRKAIAAAPAMGAPWWSLASLGGNHMEASERDALRTALGQAKAPEDRMYLAFAEATLADRAGEYEQAFDLLTEANRLRRSQMVYDGASFVRRMEAIANALDENFFAERKEWGSQDNAPIFIVGMPRSGSTLIERILGGHSAIKAGGEMPIITSLLRETAATKGLDPEREIVDLLGGLQERECAALGTEYIRRARDRCGNARHFTDKLPHNWAEIAFIRLILPRAAMIDIRRGALDCIVSNFVLLFQPGHPASYDLLEMASYYSTYVRTMEWAEGAMPGAVYHLSYEALVNDTERELRRIFNYLELDFQASCMEPGSDQAIATASAEQARQPINRAGIGRWRRFEPWLGPLRERLGSLADE